MGDQGKYQVKLHMKTLFKISIMEIAVSLLNYSINTLKFFLRKKIIKKNKNNLVHQKLPDMWCMHLVCISFSCFSPKAFGNLQGSVDNVLEAFDATVISLKKALYFVLLRESRQYLQEKVPLGPNSYTHRRDIVFSQAVRESERRRGKGGRRGGEGGRRGGEGGRRGGEGGRRGGEGGGRGGEGGRRGGEGGRRGGEGGRRGGEGGRRGGEGGRRGGEGGRRGGEGGAPFERSGFLLV